MDLEIFELTSTRHEGDLCPKVNINGVELRMQDGLELKSDQAEEEVTHTKMRQ